MSKLGWIEGKNITIEYRFAEQKNERLPELAADLVRLKVDLIVVTGAPDGVSGEESNHYHPHRDDELLATPWEAGLVASLARPGGNVTGFSSLASELNTKRLEILKDAVPKLARVGLLRTIGGQPPTERAQGCGSGTEAKIGGDRGSTRRQRFRERLSNRQAEAGGRDYDDHHSLFFRRKKADRRACRQIPVAGYLLSEGVCR